MVVVFVLDRFDNNQDIDPRQLEGASRAGNRNRSDVTTRQAWIRARGRCSLRCNFGGCSCPYSGSPATPKKPCAGKLKKESGCRGGTTGRHQTATLRWTCKPTTAGSKAKIETTETISRSRGRALLRQTPKKVACGSSTSYRSTSPRNWRWSSAPKGKQAHMT